ncbi:MAG: M16 family metallopeptidase [Patescibacteria group bacterium]
MLKDKISFYSQINSRFGLQSLEIWIPYGFRHENSTEEGYTHLIEHLMMSGSKTYPTEKELANVIDKTGAIINATTSTEYMRIYSLFIPEHLKLITSVLFDKIFNPIINQKKIEKEIKILESEAEHNKSNPFTQIQRLATAQILNSSGIKTVINGEKPKNTPTAEILKDFYYKRLTNSKIIVSTAGPLKKDKVITEINHSLKDLNTYSKIKIPNSFNLEKIPTKIVNNKNKHLAISFKTPSAVNDLNYVFKIIGDYLTGGYNSELYQKLRLKEELIYSATAKNVLFSDIGIFSIYTHSHNINKTIDKIFEILNNLTENPQKIDWNTIKDRLILKQKQNSLSSPLINSYHNSHSFITTGEFITLKQEEEKIKRINLKDIRKVLKYLKLNKAVITTIK